VKKFVDVQLANVTAWTTDLQQKANMWLQQQNTWEFANQIGNFYNDTPNLPEGVSCAH
jgi:hypothetical protein